MQNFSDQRDYSNKDKIIFFNEKLQPDLCFKFKVLTPFRKINHQLSNDQKVNCEPSKRLIFNCQPSNGFFPLKLRRFSSFALHFTLCKTLHSHDFLPASRNLYIMVVTFNEKNFIKKFLNNLKVIISYDV